MRCLLLAERVSAGGVRSRRLRTHCKGPEGVLILKCEGERAQLLAGPQDGESTVWREQDAVCGEHAETIVRYEMVTAAVHDAKAEVVLVLRRLQSQDLQVQRTEALDELQHRLKLIQSEAPWNVHGERDERAQRRERSACGR